MTHGSSERTDRTLVFALDPRGDELLVSGVRQLDGSVLGSPVASRRGISFPFRGRGERTWAPGGVRPEDLRASGVEQLGAVL